MKIRYKIFSLLFIIINTKELNLFNENISNMNVDKFDTTRENPTTFIKLYSNDIIEKKAIKNEIDPIILP